MKKTETIILGLILIAFVLGIYFYQFYPLMPEKMASHWNAKGEVNGYMSKFWGLFLIPVALSGLALLFAAIPMIDPLKANIEKFRKYYDEFIILFFIFMLSIYFHGILWNIGIEISPNTLLPVSLGILFFYVGNLLGHVKMNWFIGIRTPWTMSSEVVWDKTHKIGGKLFKIAGVITFAGVFFEDYVLFFMVVPVILVVSYMFVYSYVEYRKIGKRPG